MMNMKYKIGFVSLGCPKNLTDTETMLGILSFECEIVTNPEKADIIIVNTCGFIESAKQESIDAIIEMGKYKATGILKKLIVTGCLAQRYADEILSDLPEVDAVVGTGSYFEIQKIIADVMKGDKIKQIGDVNSLIPENLPRRLATPRHSAYLRIADGCDNYCTYCIIPKLRGKYRSRTIESIVQEAENLSNLGVTELNLIAQDTTSYGMDLYGEKVLYKLLEKLAEVKNIKWIRLHYCYPENVTDELISVIAKNPKVCKYIDIPFQHASDNILKRMGRKNTAEQNERLISKLKAEVENIVIRSTFIVGFPGETEEDFEILKNFIKVSEFDRVGVFTYSSEEGTPAANMENQINEPTKKNRQDEIMLMQQKISLTKNEKKIGNIITVLIDKKLGKNLYECRSEGDSPDIDCKVIIKGENLKAGDYIFVNITGASEYDLEGETI